MVPPGDPLPGIPHGKASSYTNKGCRCLPCRQAAYAATQEWKARKARRQRIPHGTRAGWKNWHCKCGLCQARKPIDQNARRLEMARARRERKQDGMG